VKAGCLAAVLGVAACSGSLPDRGLGGAADPLVGAYAIAGVRASPGTVHFSGLPALLDSAEGMGPMVVTTNVGVFILPAMSTTVTGLDRKSVARAVGYNLSERHDVIAVSTATFDKNDSERLEAYGAFDQTLWEVQDPASGALLGTGASFNPSGVFFQTVPAYHVPLPDMGLFTVVPGCENLACTLPPGPGGPGEEGDAGTAASSVPGVNPLVTNAGPVERTVPGFVPGINPLLFATGGRR
jgi:hypothetical protein